MVFDKRGELLEVELGGAWHLIDAKRGKLVNVMMDMLSTCELISAKNWQMTTNEILTGLVRLLKNIFYQIHYW